MTNPNVNMVELAVKIGDAQKGLYVVGKDQQETQKNLLRIFEASGRDKTHNKSANQS